MARYDAKEDAGSSAEVELLLALGLDDHSTVVDLGAGTGQLVLAVAPHCARVSPFTWLLEPMMERSGFAIEEASYSADGCDAAYVARAR